MVIGSSYLHSVLEVQVFNSIHLFARDIHIQILFLQNNEGNGSGDVFHKYIIKKQKTLLLDGEWHWE